MLTTRSCSFFQSPPAAPFPNLPAVKPMSVKASSEKCPECREKEKEALEIQEQTRQKRADAIKFWQDQSENMKQRIIETDDNDEVMELGRMLHKCNALRAGKIKEVELEAATNSPASHPAVSMTLKKRLENTKEKIDLMLEAAGNLRDQEDHRIGEHEDEAGYSNELALLKANCKEWWNLFDRISELKEAYEKYEKYGERVRAGASSVEEKLGEIWKDAIRLMKS